MLDGDGTAPTAAQDIAGEGGCHSVGGRVAGCWVVPVILVLPARGCIGHYTQAEKTVLFFFVGDKGLALLLRYV